MIAQDLRHPANCYFATPRYANSLWGRFVWVHQGKGRLRLTPDGLVLERASSRLEIPLGRIKSVGLGRISRWAKPFGLNYLIVRYLDDVGPAAIHLMPYESALDPTWTTSELVVDWLESLRGVDVLTNRVEPADVVTPSPRPAGVGLMLAALLVMPTFWVGWVVYFLLFRGG